MASINAALHTDNFPSRLVLRLGFDEASGNATEVEHGRGGLEGDDMRA
jgi:hypothetical protein